MELCFDRDPGRIPGSPIGDGPLQWDQCDFDAVRCGPPTPRDRSNPRDNPLTPGDSPRSVPPPGNGPGHHRPGCRWGHCGRGWPDDGRFNGLSRAPRNRRGRSPPEVDLPGTPYNSSVRGVGRKDRDGLARRFPTVTTPTDELTSFDEKISIARLASVGARARLRLARRLGAISLIDTIDFVGAIGFVWRIAIDFVRRGERRSPRTRHASGTGNTSTPGSREVLLLPRPLRTGRESCPSSSSGLHKRPSRDAAAFVRRSCTWICR